jgi:hypothetical protein
MLRSQWEMQDLMAVLPLLPSFQYQFIIAG